jgi:hypothetical protein
MALSIMTLRIMTLSTMILTHLAWHKWREPKSWLGWSFNFKLDSFAS